MCRLGPVAAVAELASTAPPFSRLSSLSAAAKMFSFSFPGALGASGGDSEAGASAGASAAASLHAAQAVQYCLNCYHELVQTIGCYEGKNSASTLLTESVMLYTGTARHKKRTLQQQALLPPHLQRVSRLQGGPHMQLALLLQKVPLPRLA